MSKSKTCSYFLNLKLQNRIYCENLNKFFIFLVCGLPTPTFVFIKKFGLGIKNWRLSKKRAVRPPLFLFYFYICFALKKNEALAVLTLNYFGNLVLVGNPVFNYIYIP